MRSTAWGITTLGLYHRNNQIMKACRDHCRQWLPYGHVHYPSYQA